MNGEGLSGKLWQGQRAKGKGKSTDVDRHFSRLCLIQTFKVPHKYVL
jgi:hypothetical protein